MVENEAEEGEGLVCVLTKDNLETIQETQQITSNQTRKRDFLTNKVLFDFAYFLFKEENQFGTWAI